MRIDDKALAPERGIIYVQPSYHYRNTLLRDLEVMKKDLDVIRAADFTNVGLRVSWGEIMSKCQLHYCNCKND